MKFFHPLVALDRHNPFRPYVMRRSRFFLEIQSFSFTLGIHYFFCFLQTWYLPGVWQIRTTWSYFAEIEGDEPPSPTFLSNDAAYDHLRGLFQLERLWISSLGRYDQSRGSWGFIKKIQLEDWWILHLFVIDKSWWFGVEFAKCRYSCHFRFWLESTSGEL